MTRFKYFRTAPFTWLMALSILGLFTATWLAGGDAAASKLFTAGTLANERFFAGEWWRLFSSELVHSSWDHVLWNCAGLVLVGLALEPRLGTRRTALIYILGAMGASIVTLVFCSRTGGASAAIYALIGAYLTRPLRRRRSGSLAIGLGWIFAAWWVFRGLSSGAGVYELGHEAHVGGLIVGLCCGALLEDRGEPRPERWMRSHRFAAASLASVGLVVALMPDPRWNLGWHRNAARRAEGAGDLNAAARHWTAIVDAGDPHNPVDAVFIENAARFRLRRHDYIGARTLLRSVAPTLDDAKIYRDTGFLTAQHEPYDDRAALRDWRRAAALNPCMPEVLDAIAMAIVSAENSTVGRPEEARALACRAVAQDRMRTPEFLRTLAWAHYCCGDTGKGILWMRRAISLNPKTRALYVSELEGFEAEQATHTSEGGRTARPG